MDKHDMNGTLFCSNYTITAADLNHYGIIHGGRLLTLCDETAYVSAHRHANSACLTRAVHRAQFHRGVRQGEELLLTARVGLTGHSSIWVPVCVSLLSDEQAVMDAVFVFVAIDNQHKAQPVAPVIAMNDEELQTQKRLEMMRDQLNLNV